MKTVQGTSRNKKDGASEGRRTPTRRQRCAKHATRWPHRRRHTRRNLLRCCKHSCQLRIHLALACFSPNNTGSKHTKRLDSLWPPDAFRILLSIPFSPRASRSCSCSESCSCPLVGSWRGDSFHTGCRIASSAPQQNSFEFHLLCPAPCLIVSFSSLALRNGRM
jgi:hypothetical protein